MIKHTNRVIETALCRLSTASTRTKNRKEDPWLPEWKRWSNYKIAALPKPAPRCAEVQPVGGANAHV
jgi:hypothetical protein